jgi:large subunit ribosomal protein L13
MPKTIITRETHTLDASGVPLGRLAVKVAILLRGKNKTNYIANLDQGDFVIITNASKVKFTGRKFTDKKYFWHTFHPGGKRQPTIERLFLKSPKKVIERAVYGMLPKNKLRAGIIKRLKVEI